MSKEKLIKAKQGALMSLIDVMKGLQLEKMKGFKKKEDDKPAMEAVAQKLDPEMLAKAKKDCEEEDDE